MIDLDDERLEVLRDYEIIVEDPKKHIPWAIFSFTADAYEFLAKIKKRYPETPWQVITLEEWFNLYEGETK